MNTRTHSFHRIAIAVLIFGVSVTAYQCIDRPDKLIAPTYEAPLYITLLDMIGYFDDMMPEDSTTVHRDNSGGYYFEDVQAGKPTGIDSIKVQPAPSVAQVALNTFQVAAIPSTKFGFSGSSFGGLSSWPPPPAPPFPGFSTTIPGEAIDFSNEFEFLAIQNGTLTLNVRNTLPVTVKFERPIRLKNNSTSPADTSTIAVFVIDSLVEGESKNVNSDLAGRFVFGAMKTDSLSFGFSSRNGPFTVDATDSLVFTFSSSIITVDSARAVIPPQTIASISDSVIVIDSTVSLSNASFSSGEFTARIVNNLDINVGILLEFDNFKNPVSGNVLRINRVLLPRQTFDFPVKLDTVNIVNPTPDLVGTNMKFSVAIQTINSGGQKSTVSSTDFVRAEFIPSGEFALKSVSGRIDPMTIQILSGASGPDLGETSDKFDGQFTFDSVRIAVGLALTGGFPTDYDLVLLARNPRTLAYDSIALPPPTGGTQNTFDPSAGPAVIELGNSQGLNTFLQKFIPDFPDSFIVRGSITIRNPTSGFASIYDTTKLYQDVTVYFPLKFGLANGKMEEMTALNPEGTFPKKFVSDVRESALQFKITNHMPAQLSFRARLVGYDSLAGKRDTLLFLPSDVPARTISAPPVDAGGSVTSPTTSQFTISLTAQEVAKFNLADSIFIRIDMQSTGNGVQPVRFRATDYVRVKLGGGLVYIVNRQD